MCSCFLSSRISGSDFQNPQLSPDKKQKNPFVDVTRPKVLNQTVERNMWVANCTVCLVSLNDMKLWTTDSTINFHAPGDHSQFYEVVHIDLPK